MRPPELFTVAQLQDAMCGEAGCDVRENPEHYTSIRLSPFVTESIEEAVSYMQPDAKNSPLAQVIVHRLQLILEADKSHR